MIKYVKAMTHFQRAEDTKKQAAASAADVAPRRGQSS
jgi:hypothetical protein